MRVRIVIVFCFLAMVDDAGAQARKLGLWETTTSMTWQQSPLPAGTAAPNGSTTLICLTQAAIDRYGGILPQVTNGCQLANLSTKADTTTADMVCSGAVNGKGSVVSTWTDAEHAKNSVHFTGTIKMGADIKPIEWTSTSTSAFKRVECGLIIPPRIPLATDK